jgi:hypothetical protein
MSLNNEDVILNRKETCVVIVQLHNISVVNTSVSCSEAH